MNFNRDPGSGDVVSMVYNQNGLPQQVFDRIRRAPVLDIQIFGGATPVRLNVEGEGDREYPLQYSTDLRHWQPMGTISIWETRKEALGGNAKYFRALEP